MNDLGELLAPYRASAGEDAIGLTLVADDAEAQKLLAAFSLCPLPRWRRPKKPAPEDLRQRWFWLWSGFPGGPDQPAFLEELAERAGVPIQTAFNRWPSLVASRLVYPDGTITENARMILRAFVVRNMPRPRAAEASGQKGSK